MMRFLTTRTSSIKAIAWTCLILTLFLGLPTQIAWGISVGGTTATLAELLVPGTSIESADGSVAFDQFAFDVSQPNTSGPVASEILVEVLTPVNSQDAVLQFSISGSSQILQADQSYELQIEYAAHSVNEELIFSSLSLDIDGATVGTTGTGLVQLHTDVFADPEPPLLVLAPVNAPPPIVDLDVIDDGDGLPSLIDIANLDPRQQDLRMAMRIEMSGGSDSSSGAVLTDFGVRFTQELVIPEPSSLLLATLACGALLMLNHGRK